MRRKIAAANWKMNLEAGEAERLLKNILSQTHATSDARQAVFAVPYPYLTMASSLVGGREGVSIAAQNCHHKPSGAFTGEVSASMLRSLRIPYVILGHSERREYNHETDEILAQKVDIALSNQLIPIFCCGESLSIREAGEQNTYVGAQLRRGLFHLSQEQIRTLVIAYEPIWAIGTGRTASSAQAQEMHAALRDVIATHYGKETAEAIPILYGGSVKASNAGELFSQPDVDGGLVGGASLDAAEFGAIIDALP
jgi:triosephosphate isomerase